MLDILILCTFICFILQLGSLFIPQRKVGTSDVVTQASKQKDCFFPVDSPSPADRKLDTSPRDLVVGRSPMPFSLETSSSEYLKPFQSDTNTG